MAASMARGVADAELRVEFVAAFGEAVLVIRGFGFWRGLSTRLKPPGAPAATPVTLETISV